MPRGGKRKGAGRKPALNKKKQYATRLLPATIKFLKTLDNAAAWLEAAIQEKRDRELKKPERTYKSVLCRNWRHI